MQSTGTMALGAAMIANAPKLAGAAPKSDSFNIDESFAAFMRGIGGTASDGGGKVVFTGQDPLVRSHFRIGASMAIPAMAAGVGAAGIWKERAGQGLDVSEICGSYLQHDAGIGSAERQERLGKVAMDDPLPGTFTWMPTINGRNVQAPLLFGNPLSFTIFETKDRRQVTPTGLYPRHFGGFLSIIGAAPNRELVTERHSTPTTWSATISWCSRAADGLKAGSSIEI